MILSQPALYLMLFFIGLALCLFGSLIWFTELGNWYPEGHPKLQELGITPPTGAGGIYLRNTALTGEPQLGETPFVAIPNSFWYVVVTITTVGYGEMNHSP